MRIFARQAMQFHHPEDRSITFTVKALSFEDAPDWVRESDMFKLADRADLLSVAESSVDEREIEANGGRKRGKKTAEPDAGVADAVNANADLVQ
ncbi:hypothetical protein LJK87_00010 [Paenibacillus sp. P25]|nr:hypothetical protein LJK87_00010 [Paenibacillus sp. P25]